MTIDRRTLMMKSRQRAITTNCFSGSGFTAATARLSHSFHTGALVGLPLSLVGSTTGAGLFVLNEVGGL